jgi:hypothetical protein
MRCNNCEQEIANGSRFCEHCGTRVETDCHCSKVSIVSSFLFAFVLSFLPIPPMIVLIILLVLVLIWKNLKKRNSVKVKTIWWAIVGMVCGFIIRLADVLIVNVF